MHILFASSEIFPFAKTGGLADASYSLTQALSKYAPISRVMPLYSFIMQDQFERYDNFTITLDEEDYPVEIFVKKEQNITTYFIKIAPLSQTESLYGDVNGDYPDNALRFGLFCMAIVQLALRLSIKLIHLNDWHTAMVAFFIKRDNLAIKTVLTIHNLAYQGIFDAKYLPTLGITHNYFTMDSLEFYGKINFLKAGIAYCDMLTTVSHIYAREILTQEFGCGLEGFLQLHQKKLVGILNGIDYSQYKAFKNKEQKEKEKKNLCQQFGLQNHILPLFIMVSRLVAQKGVDLFIEALPQLEKKEINIFLVGEGEQSYCSKLQNLSQKYNNFAFYEGYNERLSKQSYLAADFLLMPSVFEPCGLNQFIAMRNGTIPIVHAVGGLKESVHESQKQCGEGFCYQEQNQKEFFYAIERALKLYEKPEQMDAVRAFNVQCDFSFQVSAKKYLAIYERVSCN